MKKKLLIALLSASMVLTAAGAFAACDNEKEPEDPGKQEQPETNKPTITVTPKSVEIYAGDEFDLLFGVTVKDGDGNVVEEGVLVIADDFDQDTPGEYTITYSITIDGETVTETRTVTVLEQLAPLTLEVQANKLGESKWQGNLLNFKHQHYQELSSNTELPAQSGVFKNTSSSEIVLSIEGSHAVAAIIDANGVVIEGRDGANSNLVNAENPVRASSSVKTLTVNGETQELYLVPAMDMHIPAGGYAIVVQSNYVAQGSTDVDGRGFMNYNVIGDYGNVVRLYWSDAEEGEYLTPYENQGPTVSGNTPVYVVPGSDYDPLTALKDGLTVKDDNGTFDTTDDILLSADSITVEPNEDFDINVVGDYTFNLVATDGEKTTSFTRVVKIVDESYLTKISIGSESNSISVLKTAVAKDIELTSIGSYAFIIYTYEFKAENESLGFANGYGEAYVVDKYGKIVRTYDGANGNYYDADHLSGIKDAELCSPTSYAAQAYASLQEGETVFIAPHSTANSAAGGSRHFLSQLANRTQIGANFTFTDFEFEEKPYVITIGEGDGAKSFSALESKYAYNIEVTAATAPKYAMIVYTKDYDGTVAINGFGVAIVIDKCGKLIKLYDGANGGVYDESGKLATNPEGFTTAAYATFAFENLNDGELLIIFPNDGGANEARAFALGLRTDGSIGKTVTITDIKFADPNEPEEPVEPVEKSIDLEIGSKKLSVLESKYAYNTEVTAATAPNYGMIVYTKDYDGTVAINGYGVAIVLDKYGKLVKLYDGANVGVYEETGKIATPDGFSAANYATFAFENLNDGEMLIIFPNDSGANESRAFALGLRTDGSIGKAATLSGVEFEFDGTIITIGQKEFKAPKEAYAYNTEVTLADAGKYKMIAYTTEYEGTVALNGYGAAIVLDAQGKLIKVYDAANVGVYDETGKIATPEGFSAANYSTFAFENLNDGELLIVFPNDGTNAADSARTFALGLRTDGSIGKTATVTGITFESAEA